MEARVDEVAADFPVILGDPSRLLVAARRRPGAPARRDPMDRLARLAARLLDAPAVLIGLVDEERNVVVGSCGLPEPLTAESELPVGEPLWALALASQGSLRIDAARDDARYRELLAVTSLGIEGYLTMPLVAPGGESVGTICVLDFAPHAWTDSDVQTLQDLASIAQTELELGTSRAEAERAVARLEEVFARAPALIALTRGPEHTYVLANDPYRHIAGECELIGRTVAEAWPELEEQGHYDLLDRVYATGETFVADELLIKLSRAEGEPLQDAYFNFVYQPVRDLTGATEGIFIHAVEVTDLVRSRRLAEVQNETLVTALLDQPLADVLDRLTRSLEAEASGTALAAVMLVEPDGEHLVHLSAPSLPDTYIAAIDGVEIGSRSGPCPAAADRDERVVVADIEHDPRWTAGFRDSALAHGLRACWSMPIRSSSGDVLGVFAVYYGEVRSPTIAELALVDVVSKTAAIAIERQRAEDERARLLRETKERAQAAEALEHIEDGVVVVDHDGVVRLWNPGAASVAGLTSAAAIGRHIDKVIPGWASAAPTGDGVHEIVPLELSGCERWVFVSAVRIDDGIVYAFRDVTDEHELDRLRSEIVATVSHELRTPLAAVYGAAQLLRRSDAVLLPDVREKLLDVIDLEAKRLAAIIEEILVVHTLDSGGVPLSVSPVDSAGIAAGVVETAKALGNTSITLDADPDLPVLADPVKLRQVLVNLLENARKYSPPGARVRVRVARIGDRVRFEVEDEGTGISAHEQRRIFEKFHRVDADGKTGVGGAGLGLYISRELVERMLGEISVVSEPGRGSTFAVELPVAL